MLKQFIILVLIIISIFSCNDNIEKQDKKLFRDAPLFQSVHENNHEKLEEIIENGLLIKYHVHDYFKNTPLMLGAIYGDYRLNKLLLDSGSAVNSMNKLGYTSLHIASYRSRPEIVRLYLDYGADVNAQTNSGETPLHICIKSEYALKNRIDVLDTVETLVDAGADVNLVDSEGLSPLHYAVDYFKPSVVELLLQSGAERNIKSIKEYDSIFHPENYRPSITPLELCRLKIKTKEFLNMKELKEITYLLENWDEIKRERLLKKVKIGLAVFFSLSFMVFLFFYFRKRRVSI